MGTATTTRAEIQALCDEIGLDDKALRGAH
jgi:hypothetical protein